MHLKELKSTSNTWKRWADGGNSVWSSPLCRERPWGCLRGQRHNQMSFSTQLIKHRKAEWLFPWHRSSESPEFYWPDSLLFFQGVRNPHQKPACYSASQLPLRNRYRENRKYSYMLKQPECSISKHENYIIQKLIEMEVLRNSRNNVVLPTKRICPLPSRQSAPERAGSVREGWKGPSLSL